MDQFKDAINDLKGRRAVLERQFGHLETETKTTEDFSLPTYDQIDNFCEMAKGAFSEELYFDEKQIIIRDVVDTIIAQQRQLRVRGYLPVLLRKEDENVKSYSEG